jgi:hypothetical protein
MPGRGAVATGSTTFGASITWEDGLKYRNAAIAAITRAIAVFILSGYVSVARFDYLESLPATHPGQTPQGFRPESRSRISVLKLKA